MRRLPHESESPPSSPIPDESAAAREALRGIAPFLADAMGMTFRISGSKQTVALPARAVRLLADLLSEMAKGKGVTLIPNAAVLTTRQAAELLGMSRPMLVELLETRQLPFYKVGTHRRVRLQDVTRLKAEIAGMGTVSEESLENEPEPNEPLKTMERSLLGRALQGRSSPLAYEWTPEAMTLLGKYSDQEIAKQLGISRSAVTTRRHMCGIPACRSTLRATRDRSAGRFQRPPNPGPEQS